MRIAMMALVLSVLLGACSKDKGCKNVSPAEEDASLVAYNAAHSITATKHPTGLYYQIITAGSSSRPKSTSTIFVTYTGKKFDDTVFDSATNPGATGFYMAQLIQAWQIALPLIGKGGRILITVPSSLGYGCQGSGTTIPANTPLYFDITLVDFN